MKREKYAQRKQHFVPACYLKAWLDPSAPKTATHNPYVWLFDKNGKNPKAKAPEKIFIETEMYTLTGADGGRDLRLEHGLGTIESNFTMLRNRTFNIKRPLTEDDWLWVCLFAATIRVRTVLSRDHWLSQMEKIKSMVEQSSGPDWETQTVAPELPPNVDRSRVYVPQPGDFDNLKEDATRTLIESGAKAIVPALMGMHKTVLCTNNPLGFLTTDAPSTWFDPTAYQRHPFDRAVGFNSTAIEITLPISPSQCLLFTHQPFGPLYWEVPQESVDALSHRHAGHAPTTIVTRSKETRPIWFQVVEPPADSWDVLHPDPEDRRQWTNPDCPPGLLDMLDRRS